MQTPGGLLSVATRFALSAENRANFVRTLYLTYLHRPATQGEVDGQVNSGVPLLGLQEGVLSSQEYYLNG